MQLGVGPTPGRLHTSQIEKALSASSPATSLKAAFSDIFSGSGFDERSWASWNNLVHATKLPHFGCMSKILGFFLWASAFRSLNSRVLRKDY